MSIREDALQGKVTDDINICAEIEGIDVKELVTCVAEGTVAIAKNCHHSFDKIIGIGKNTSTKVNANIGSSEGISGIDEELLKLKIAIAAGADTIIDLSIGDNLDEVRTELLQNCTVPLGTVPLYQALSETFEQKKEIIELTVDHFFTVIEKQAMDGVDFMSIQCGVNRHLQNSLTKHSFSKIDSARGASFTLEWMNYHQKENPMFEQFDDLLAILREHEVTLSLGDGISSGYSVDVTDSIQMQALVTLGELTERAWDAGVQVIIEGPRHMSLNQIEAHVLQQKQICKGAPISMGGLLVTGIAPGYEHITEAIGGAVAASTGADFLCFGNSSEQFKCARTDDVHESVISSKIAAHAADIVKGFPSAIERENAMADAKSKLDWKQQIELSLDPDKAAKLKYENGTC